ncbi:bifunctional nicotinamidase/pyrazinamidase [Niabella drilacis]|uniref:nicotinamidase n=1 Tax=Niabella drilacis (strain DSM 25811 / CCM 8410 / CCUG 62505 / LMG 26954 / E90) TaxID=1285928 RepID=A0A1G6NY86_NIADE|nr:bifunctional nicotinamidase/pyrazinamidase [Niabella drilacis]SDC72314.1 nicotinamidase/pyrazinamidase [Niabella drilacis]
MKCLVIVDMQYDFLPGGALPVPGGDRLIPVINRLQQDYALVVATQDWHPADHKSFASQHKGQNPFDVIDWKGGRQTLWPDHCVQGTPGAALHRDIDQRRIEAIFRKGMNPEIDSYSGFFDNGHLRATGLGSYLEGRGVDEVHVCGLAADFCVNFTALDALGLGLRAVIIESATLPINAAAYATVKRQFIERGGALQA